MNILPYRSNTRLILADGLALQIMYFFNLANMLEKNILSAFQPSMLKGNQNVHNIHFRAVNIDLTFLILYQ